VNDDSNDAGRRDDEPDREQSDRPQIFFKGLPVGEPAAGVSSGGRKMKKISSGSMMTGGRFGTKARSDPPMTNAIG